VPPPRGFGGCAPKSIKIGDELPTLTNPPRVGPNTLANPQPTGVGTKRGSRGRSPHGRGSWGVSPHKFKRGGEAPTLTTPPRVGPRTLANIQPTGVGKRGSRGAKPPWRGGCGGCAPFTPTEVSLFEKGRPSPTLIKPGVEGACAPSQGGLEDVPFRPNPLTPFPAREGENLAGFFGQGEG